MKPQQPPPSIKIVTNGPQPKRPVAVTRRPVTWYRILMSHTDGTIRYTAGTATAPRYRGISSIAIAEDLAKRGLIDPTPYSETTVVPDPSYVEYSTKDGTPVIASDPGARVESPISKMLETARKTVWNPNKSGGK